MKTNLRRVGERKRLRMKLVETEETDRLGGKSEVPERVREVF